VIGIGIIRNACKILVRSLIGTAQLGNQNVDVRIIRQRVLKCGLKSSGLRWRDLMKTIMKFQIP